MDLEKVKKNYNWDPVSGDYVKNDVLDERRNLRKKQIRNKLLLIIYLIILILSIILVYISIENVQ